MKPIRIGLVELHVDLAQVRRRSRDVFECLREGIAADNGRLVRVHAALAAARSAGCKLIVFPGWTFVGNSLPRSILGQTKGLTVVCEAMRAITRPSVKSGRRDGFPWSTYVVQDGRVLLRAE